MSSTSSRLSQPDVDALDPETRGETPPQAILASSPAPDQTSNSPAERFGNHSSSYWPPEWNFSRYTNATGLELRSLPDDQYPKLQAGLLDVFGEDGLDDLNDYLHKLARQRAGNPASYPDWLRHLRQFHDNQTWGFFGLQTTCFDDQDRWVEFKAKLNDVVWASSQTATDTITSDLAEAKAKFEIQWVEDPAMALSQDGQGPSLDSLRKRFKQVITEEHRLPDAVFKDIFLVASEDAITSVLDTSVPAIIRFHDPDTSESTKANRRGPDGVIDPPYVLAVAADEPRPLDEDNDGHGWFKPVFKVAAELLVTDFWHELEFRITRNGEPLMKLTRHTKGVDLLGKALGDSQGGGNAGDQDVWWGSLVPRSRRAKRRRVL